MHKIDFVITWLDSKDPIWCEEYNKYNKESKYETVADMSTSRFRNWENLKYWFRCIEMNSPWVNKIHFITSGHLPPWLNINHPKINIVTHSDYIDEEYLPTFNSRVIELNLFKLKDLSENFVLFNDDFFITSKVNESDFFYRGVPKDFMIHNAESGGGLSPVIMNNLELINDGYSKRLFLKNSFSKVFNLNYRHYNFRSFMLLPWPRYTGFFESHLPQPYLKSSCKSTYLKYKYNFDNTFNSRFRLKSDVNHYLFRYEALVNGKFHPAYPRHLGKYFSICDENVDEISNCISNKKYKTIALNDNDNIYDFELLKDKVNRAFDSIYNDKSSFEL